MEELSINPGKVNPEKVNGKIVKVLKLVEKQRWHTKYQEQFRNKAIAIDKSFDEEMKNLVPIGKLRV